MAIALFFSGIVFQLVMSELEGQYGRQEHLFHERLPGLDSITQYLSDRQSQLSGARWSLIGDLAVTNVAILGLGGLTSYYLARRTLRPIEEAHDAQTRFTADASHELRTPLAAMRTEIEVSLLDPKLTLAGAKEQLNSNLEELIRLTTLSEGLLELARLDVRPLTVEATDLGSIVDTAVATVQPLANKKGIHIEVRLGEGTQVVGEEISLSESLTIFLDNAVKYSPKGSTVVMAAHKQARHIVISIKDTGVGIAEDILPHIFERFYRGDASRSTGSDTRGYGLGLPIAKRIIELHSGNVQIKSKPGKGTVVTVTLPV